MSKFLTFLLFSVFVYSADEEPVGIDENQLDKLEDKKASVSQEATSKSDENTETNFDDFVDQEGEFTEEINLKSDKDSALIDTGNFDEDIKNINDNNATTSIENTKTDINLNNSDAGKDSSLTFKIIIFVT